MYHWFLPELARPKSGSRNLTDIPQAERRLFHVDARLLGKQASWARHAIVSARDASVISSLGGAFYLAFGPFDALLV
jgi:hypothetical protein